MKESARISKRFPSVERKTSKITGRRIIVCFDSRERVPDPMSTPSKYKTLFPNIYGITSARLIDAQIPQSQYAINEKNNWVDLVDVGGGTGLHSFQVPPGTYSGSDLANQLNTLLNQAVGVGPGVILLLLLIL